MREIRQSGSEGGAAEINPPFLPLSTPTLAGMIGLRFLRSRCWLNSFWVDSTYCTGGMPVPLSQA